MKGFGFQDGLVAMAAKVAPDSISDRAVVQAGDSFGARHYSIALGFTRECPEIKAEVLLQQLLEVYSGCVTGSTTVSSSMSTTQLDAMTATTQQQPPPSRRETQTRSGRPSTPGISSSGLAITRLSTGSWHSPGTTMQ